MYLLDLIECKVKMNLMILYVHIRGSYLTHFDTLCPYKMVLYYTLGFYSICQCKLVVLYNL